MPTLTIDVTKLIRPSLTFEEIQTDNGLVPGESYWSAIHFDTDHDIKSVYGRHDIINIKINQCEMWQCTEAFVMLSGNGCKYIMTYNGISRIRANSVNI